MACFKICVYTNCENFYNSSLKTYSKENITLFQFPKDIERRQRWMRLGKVRPNMPENHYYFCSDHFDKRYLCVRQRRTILVGDAVPYEYEGQVDSVDTAEYITTDELSDEYYGYDMKDNVEDKQDQDVLVESTTVMDDDDLIQIIRNEIYMNDGILHQNLGGEVICEDKAYNKRSNRRKSVDMAAPVSSSNVQILKTMNWKSASSRFTDANKMASLQPPVAKEIVKCRPQNIPEDIIECTELIKTDSRNDNCMTEEHIRNVTEENTDISPESIINDQQTTTFIFKGEEYIQMSKKHYIDEKMELMKKMECAIYSIKMQLNSI